MRSPYGWELILDYEHCDPRKFSRESLQDFTRYLGIEIGLEPCDFHPWDDDDTPPGEEETHEDLVGYSAVRFIKTSNITIHTLTLRREAYINVFSCKEFSPEAAEIICGAWFTGQLKGSRTFLERG